MSPLQENIQTAVTGIADYLSKNKTATSWQLKVMLRLSSSVLYLALGALYNQGKVTLEADGINYHVTWTDGMQTPPAPPQDPFEQAL